MVLLICLFDSYLTDGQLVEDLDGECIDESVEFVVNEASEYDDFVAIEFEEFVEGGEESGGGERSPPLGSPTHPRPQPFAVGRLAIGEDRVLVSEDEENDFEGREDTVL